MVKSARALFAGGVAASAVLLFGGVAVQARGGAEFDLQACDAAIRRDLAAEFGSLSGAAAGLGMTQAALTEAVAATCLQERDGAQAAAVARGEA